MDKALFAEFPPITDEQWQQLVLKDLRGAAPETLEWNSPEGIKVEPYYRASSQQPLTIPVRPIGEWLIQQDIEAADASTANKIALDALERGATALSFTCHADTDVNTLLKDVLVEHIHTAWQFTETATLDSLITLINERGLEAEAIKGSINFHPSNSAAYFGKYQQQLPGFKLFTIEANPETTLTEQTAEQLAAAVKLVNELTEAGNPASEVLPSIQFNIAVGTDYFFEIARIRALRALWLVICQQYVTNYNNPAAVHAINKAVLPEKDGYYEMIRQTTQALSAVIGGADSLSITPHISTPDKSAGFQTRIARNVQLILNKESHLDTVVDPAAGSWYIESITSQLATNSWKRFLQLTQPS